MANQSRVGFWVLLGKLGPKLYAVFSKMFDVLLATAKSASGLKVAGAAGSVGLYTYLFTWEMAISLVVFIGIHEYGHLFAMKRCGIRTKGMFFIPGFGAVAVADERFGSAQNEAYIAIMGPVVGLVFFVLPTYIAYLVTGNALWAAVGGITCFINLLNLFPMNPLDGGRILKALAYSKHCVISLSVIVAVSLVTMAMGAALGFWLLAYIAIIGLFELAADFGIREHLEYFFRTLKRLAVGSILVLLTMYFLGIFLFGLPEGSWGWSDLLWHTLLLVVWFALIAVSIANVNDSTAEADRSRFAYPLIVIKDAWEGCKEFKRLRGEDIKPIENYTIMRPVPQ
ncbi:MAG: hypothetical protein A2762_02610 [Candidatus Lloydbacteria bacterium RIFCSPHIGHO2_01_FULL_54_11]|nr:MAG: hypothetical protein A2762_02610 [Candidatus Lloydbacteria bacterium RIFCSPHIGHO2_01_FULL_54_11]OGZ16295.1 MAG: hypothetical protein A3H76_04635 [Candidatus Lloydbacteria bacterium RIFCSPLOWO2_02_FULL_54_12]